MPEAKSFYPASVFPEYSALTNSTLQPIFTEQPPNLRSRLLRSTRPDYSDDFHAGRKNAAKYI